MITERRVKDMFGRQRKLTRANEAPILSDYDVPFREEYIRISRAYRKAGYNLNEEIKKAMIDWYLAISKACPIKDLVEWQVADLEYLSKRGSSALCRYFLRLQPEDRELFIKKYDEQVDLEKFKSWLSSKGYQLKKPVNNLEMNMLRDYVNNKFDGEVSEYLSSEDAKLYAAAFRERYKS